MTLPPTPVLPQNRRLLGILKRRATGGRVLRLTTLDQPDITSADGVLIWRGDIMSGADLDIDLLAEQSSATLGTITITEKATAAIVAGPRRVIITTPTAWAVAKGDALVLAVQSVLAGYAPTDVVATGPNTISVGLICPAIAVGASYSLSSKLIRFTA